MPEKNVAGWRWQDAAQGGGLMDETHIQRRVVGFHDIRFDGLSDLLMRARGASVLDIGCNRGHVAYEFFVNGARLVHGCDIYGPGIEVAKHWFAELPHVASKFAVVDLTKPRALEHEFGMLRYNIVLYLGVHHKLKRIMSADALIALVRDIGQRAITYLAFTGYPGDLPELDRELKGLKRIHTSELGYPDRPAAIWKRGA